jgi:hypothetical protein
MVLRRLPVVLACLLAFGSPLQAQSITSLSVDEGTTGTQLTIEGTGFGTKKPKVELFDLELEKKAKGSSLKLLESTDTSLTVEIKKAAAGSYRLRVRPKGKGIEPAVSGDDFVVRPPAIQVAKGLGGSPGDSFELGVDFLGLKKPKVKIGGKATSAKVVGASTLSVKIPKSLANGTWPVVLSTKVGSDTAGALVTVTGSKKAIGKPTFALRVDGSKLKISKKQLVVETTPAGVSVVASRTKKGVEQRLTLLLPFAPGDDAIPGLIAGVPDGGGLMSYDVISDGGAVVESWVLGTMDAEFNAYDGSRLAGAASGALSPAPTNALASAGTIPVVIEVQFVFDALFADTTPSSDMLTSLQGLVVDTDLNPVGGADVTTAAELMTQSALDGSFVIADHPLQPAPLSVRAAKDDLSGFVLVDALVAGGVTLTDVVVLDVDTDRDGLPDWYEQNVSGTDPGSDDSDGDDFGDALELELGSDPLVFDAPTTVMGAVELPGRVPADGAQLSLVGVSTGLYTATADAGGLYTFADPWPASLSPLTVAGQLTDKSGLFSGSSAATASVPDGVTVVPAFELENSGPGTAGLYPGAIAYAGNVPQHLRIADLDGDGHADVLVAANGASLSDEQLWVLLGNGDGSYEPGVGYGVSSDGFSTEPQGFAVIDVDDDDLLDVVVANEFDDEVGVLFGLGDGTFGTLLHFAAGPDPFDVVAADFNQDDLPDLAVANSSSSQVAILLNQGGGAFGAPTTYAVGDDPVALAVGLFDADLLPDLVVANSGAGSVSVLLGIGDGTFGLATDFAVGDEPRDVAVGDLDDDGELDLVVAAEADHEVSVLLGVGDGSFGSSVEFASGAAFNPSPRSVAIGDVNADTVPDVVVANTLSSHVGVLLGAGDGSFDAPQSFPASGLPYAVGIADLNEDGAPDVASASFTADGVVTLLGAGDGTFGAPSNFDVDFTAISVVTGDVDEDGNPDAIVAKFDNGFQPNTDRVSVLLGDGAGGFGVPQDLEAGEGLVSVAVEDLDGDDHLDLIVANTESDDVSILLGAGNGSFSAATEFAVGNGPLDVAVALLDGDARPDIVTANGNADRVAVLLGTTGGDFGAAQDFVVGDGPRAVAIGDLDGDGNQDLAVANENSDDVSILLGVGDGSFGAANSIAVGEDPYDVQIADVSQDGELDVIVVNEQSHSVSVLLGNGDGSFQPAQAFAVHAAPDELSFPSPTPRSLVIGDVNQDGLPDLLTGNYLNQSFAVLLGQGGGSFGNAQAFVAGNGVTSIALGDLDGDGLLDVLTTSELIALWTSLNQL